MSTTIQSFPKLIEVLNAQKANLGTYLAQTNCGLTDTAEVANMLGNLNALDAYCDQVNAFKETAFEIKQALFNGVPGTPIPAFPTAPAAPTLTVPLAGGLTLQRNRNKKIKAAPGYTEAIGAALGLIGDEDVVIAPPTVNVFPAKIGYTFSVVVSGRGDSDAWECLVQPVGGANTWTSIGFSTTKSKDFVYHPGPAVSDNPVQLRVMVQLKKGNANYAGPSDVVLATVNP